MLQSFDQIRQLCAFSEEKLSSIIQDGLPMKMVRDYMGVSELGITDRCFVWGIDVSCFRSWCHIGTLSKENSSIVLKLAEMYSLGYLLFEQRKKFKSWMKEPILVKAIEGYYVTWKIDKLP